MTRLSLLGCVALLVSLLSFLAHAQTQPPSNIPVQSQLNAPQSIPAPPPLPKSVVRNSPSQAPVKPAANQSTSKLSMFGKPMHLSCNRSVRNLKTNKVECFGNVYVRRPTELLTADYAIVDLNNEDLHAEGNVVYFTGSTVIYGAKMDFNFATETGVIIDGRIESERYELLGEHIDRLSDSEFRIRDGEYTTCRDCPASWRLAAKSVDFEVDGYAYLGNVYVKINEAPTIYLPYVVIPVKTERQTGLLFPRFGTSELNGVMVVQPFYWAISRSTDATIGLGYYTNRGRKGEGEFRYTLTNRSKGQFNAFYLKDKQFTPDDLRVENYANLGPQEAQRRYDADRKKYQNRWAGEYSHNLELPWKIEQKMHLIDASDRDYARFFPQDISGAGEPALVSDVGISKAGRDASVWANGKRIRNNMTTQQIGFDKNTVQLLPSVSAATVDHRVSEKFPLHWGLSGNYSRFARTGPSFDPIYPADTSILRTDFLPGQTPLRQANRYIIVPELYYTTRIADVIEFVPSLQYRNYFYTFDTALAPTTNRRYLLAQNEFATTVEQVYNGTVKHKIRPSLIYSAIPFVSEDKNHPFNKQLATSGYQFDEFDIVPLSNENQLYFVPLGNSLTYQVNNKFILKSDAAPYTYKKSIEVTSGQSVNFYALRGEPSRRQILSRFFTFASVDTVRIQSKSEYFYYPYVKASTYNSNINYIFAQYSRRLLYFQRSIGLSYSYNQVTTHSNSLGANIIWSINDYFQTVSGATYQFQMNLNSAESPALFLRVNAGLNYQSPSQCYRIMLMGSRTIGTGWDVTVNVPINLSGSGFTSFTEGSVGLGGNTANPRI